MSQIEAVTIAPPIGGFVVREFRDNDFEDLVRIHNAYFPDMPTTVEYRRHEREARPESLQAHDLVGLVDGRPIVFGTYVKAVWFNDPGRAHVHYMIDLDWSGDECESRFLQALCDYAIEQGATRINSALCDRHEHHIQTLVNAGFRFALRQPVTAVNPQEFDASPYQTLIDKLAREGIVIRSLEALEDGWQRRFHEFHAEVVPDIPFTEPIQPMPWDEFEKLINDPRQYALSGKFVAMDGDRIIGVSEIQANVVDPTLGQTMLTGVRKSYRRRGIATALKASALRWAKERGMRRVITDNEENNPMLDLNKQLGFHEIFAWRHYIKDLLE